MGVQVPEGHLMPDHVHMLISIPQKYSVAEVIGYLKGEELDLDCAECGTQAAEFSGSQILGEGVLRLDRRAERGADPRLHQKSGDSRQGVGSVAIEARVLMKSHLSSQSPL